MTALSSGIPNSSYPDQRFVFKEDMKVDNVEFNLSAAKNVSWPIVLGKRCPRTT